VRKDRHRAKVLMASSKEVLPEPLAPLIKLTLPGRSSTRSRLRKSPTTKRVIGITK
jgi:hypothetical protein